MEKIISIKNLCYSIPYADSILEDVNLELGSGEIIGLLGHNGSGKTTLIDLLLGIRGVTSGEIQVIGEDPHALKRQQKEQIVFISQDVGIKGTITIGQFLSFYSCMYRHYSSEDESRLLEVFGLNKKLSIGSLSLGQQKKVQVVAGFSVRPKLLLVDEITAVLDPEIREVFFTELAALREKHSTAVILATNIAEDLLHQTSNILFLSERKATIHKPEEIIKLFNLKQIV